MRKTLVIALREYAAAVKTKAFVIGLLMMPLMMGGSILVQVLFRNLRDTTPKRFAVVDRTPKGELAPVVEKAVAAYNATQTTDPATGKPVKPPFELERVAPEDAVDRQRLELSDRVRQGELAGFLDIGPDVLTAEPALPTADGPHPPVPERAALRYQTNRPTLEDFPRRAEAAVTEHVQARRAARIGRSLAELRGVMAPVRLDSKGLSQRDADGGAREPSEQSRVASFIVPGALLMLMFMVVLMGATPLMQGIVEEKMQRIAEVLLGSVSPFQLMLGKLAGMTAVSLTMSAVYLGGGLWAAHHYGFAEHIPPLLVLWFLLYQALASLMYGSLFIAVGAACSDMKETQNLMWPVMLLACLPMFLLGSVLQEPSGAVATALSFFPFSTPMLMVMRQAIPPGVPWWQPPAAMLLVLATTALCVWVAGRIFRVGILMQGKGANLRELARWVVRG